MAEDLSKYESKSITPVDEYVSTLSHKLQKIAEKELRENEKIRSHSIKAIRDWVMENPRIIKCRLDTRFIMRALRFRKFSIPMTQEMIERYLINREGLYGYDWISNLDPLRPNLFKFLENGFVIPLPKRGKDGRLTLMLQLSQIDMSVPNPGNVALALLTLVMEVLIEDEENQVLGLNYIADFTGMSVKQGLVFPLDIWYKFGKNAEKMSAVRHKAFNIVGLPPSLSFLMNFAVKHMPEKLQKRVKFFSCPVAETGVVDLDNLPIENGGKIPLKQITDEWKKILLSKREFYLNFNNMAINRNLYPKAVLECSPETLKTPISQMDLLEKNKVNNFAENGIQGSFRRLEID